MTTKVLASLTPDQHQAVLDAVCPGCRFKLIEVWHSGMIQAEVEHFLPGTDFKMMCKANSYRVWRAEEQNATSD